MDTSQPIIRNDEVEAIGELDLDLEMLCNPALKYSKNLKHQRGRKGLESI